MAGSKLTIQPRVRASTIIEVLISMVIIMVIFGMAMMIYANVIRSSLSVKKVNAEAILNEILTNDEKTNDNSTQVLNIDDFRIEQVVKPYNSDNNLMEIDLVAYDANGQKITELHKVIIHKND